MQNFGMEGFQWPQRVDHFTKKGKYGRCYFTFVDGLDLTLINFQQQQASSKRQHFKSTTIAVPSVSRTFGVCDFWRELFLQRGQKTRGGMSCIYICIA